MPMSFDARAGQSFATDLIACPPTSSANTRSHTSKSRFRRFSSQIRFISFLFSDILSISILFFLTQWWSSEDKRNWNTFTHMGADAAHHGSQVWQAVLIIAIFCMLLGGRGHYTQRVPFWTESREIISFGFFTFLCNCVLLVGIFGAAISGTLLLQWACLVTLVIIGRRLTRAALRAADLSTLRTVIIGDELSSQRLTRALQSEALPDYEIVGEIRPNVIQGHQTPATLSALLVPLNADFVVLASSLGAQGDANLVAVLDRARIPFAVTPTTLALPVIYGSPQYFLSHNVALLSRQNTVVEPLSRALKVTFDFLIAAVLIVLLMPLLIAIAIAVRLDGGPAIFRHKRIGANNQTFKCMKFRTMRVNSDALLAQILTTDPAAAAEWAAIRKLRHDPRITRVGRFLRKTSLDELPQLFNVLRGEMSLVGPRPIVHSEIEYYGDDLYYYHQAKPGLTGLWQVSGRNNTSYAHRVQLDVWYVKNWTFWHDIAILIKTVPAVLLRQGAH